MDNTSHSLRIRRPILFWSAGLFSALCGVIMGVLFAMYSNLPALERLEEYRPNVVTRLMDRNGRQFRELYVEKRIWVSFDKIPANLRNAMVAVEDDQFFKHKGLRLLSILRALLADIRKGSMAQGGSTITQQLAKVMFLTSEKKISRKIKEALLAIEIEKRFTKEEIFEFYANQIPLGSGAFGVEAASRIYFGKPLADLTLAEAALIAGLPKAPATYSPLKNPEASITRRATVLSRMREEKYISSEEEQSALAEPLSLPGVNPQGPKADHFAEIIRIQLENRLGAAGLYREGLEVTTTLDANMQKAAETAVEEGLAAINEQEKRAGTRHDGMEAQAALVALDTTTGQILAMVGSSDFAKAQFNHATQARRQPGSAFKPFIFLSALERGYTPASVIVDSPVSFPKPGGAGFWKPENYSNKFYGSVTLRKALENSLNVSTVKLLHEMGEGHV
ncbi:MAG: transglycosylase domain-containing protein, partial [Nitrospinota bacterium]|nr:transglycosylase domain-containing protein [Nitrospinota bacterium]